jgi:hypothetical protein
MYSFLFLSCRALPCLLLLHLPPHSLGVQDNNACHECDECGKVGTTPKRSEGRGWATHPHTRVRMCANGRGHARVAVRKKGVDSLQVRGKVSHLGRLRARRRWRAVAFNLKVCNKCCNSSPPSLQTRLSTSASPTREPAAYSQAHVHRVRTTTIGHKRGFGAESTRGRRLSD